MKKEIKNYEIVDLFNNGKTIKQISETYSCNQETIRLKLKKEGVDTCKKKCNVNCIHCNGETRKEGKTNDKQRYFCLSCKKIFLDGVDERLNERLNRHEIIKNMYLRDKLSTIEIAKKLGVSSTIPQRILQKYGLTRNISEAKKLIERKSSLPIDNIISDYKSGLSSVKISEKNNCSKGTILKLLKKNNIDRNNVYEYINKYTNEIEKLYSNGKSMLIISKELNIAYTTINSVLHKLGIVRTDDKYGLGCDYNEWLKTLTVYRKYISDVGKITNKQKIKKLIHYDKRGLCGVSGAYQLDHKYSILQGFKDGIDAEIIGNIVNLEFIPWEDNTNKKSSCSIIKEELLEKYYKSLNNL